MSVWYCTGADGAWLGRDIFAGSAWHPGPNGGCGEGYNCYKVIAGDLGLDGPWLQLGTEENESLVAAVRNVIKRAQDSLIKPDLH